MPMFMVRGLLAYCAAPCVLQVPEADDLDEDLDFGDAERGQEDTTDWVKLNKRFKTKSGAWARSAPGPRLALLGMSTRVAELVMQPFLYMAGHQWDMDQRQKVAAGRITSAISSRKYICSLRPGV